MTPEGELVLAAAMRMKTASFDFMRARNQSALLQGEVRVSVTEGLGTFWLAPRIVEFQQAHPQLTIDLRCAMHPADVLRLETDLAVQITPPRDDSLKVVKLGRMHAVPFASKEYLERHGAPRTANDLLRHKLVLQLADHIASMEDFVKVFRGMPEPGTVAMKSNVSSAHYWLIARGGGIGMLPTYANALGSRVVPIEVEDIRLAYDIFLTYHPDASGIPRVRLLIDWLIEAFSPKRYPWFRDEFISPHDLPANINDIPTDQLFEGFAGAIVPGPSAVKTITVRKRPGNGR